MMTKVMTRMTPETRRRKKTREIYRGQTDLCKKALQTVLSDADQFVTDLLYVVLVVLSATNKDDHQMNQLPCQWRNRLMMK